MIDSILKNARILIVDDQQANLDVITGLLEMQGYMNVKTTTDSLQVVGMFKKFKPDLILLDLAMPKLTGFQVMKQLKPLIPEGWFMPILVLTADTSEKAKQRSLAGGAKDFLTKPFDLIEVDLRIKNLLETRYMHQRLENQNQILDEKVKERTVELVKTNNELVIAIGKAEASDRLKSTFINNISHEVRTPLNGILGFSKLLTGPDLSSEEKEHFIEYLEASSDRLITTITDYMDISMITSGTIPVQKNVIHLNSFLDELNAKFHSRCAAKNLEWHMELPDGSANLKLHTDPVNVEKALIHLLNNAVKFTRAGSITFGYTVKKSVIEFFIKDTGIGIDPEAMTRIFENFGQEEIGQTRNYDGSGLGLSITRGLVRLLGGDVKVESEKGVGSHFYLTIPLDEKKLETPELRNLKKEPVTSSQSTVLIVEDDIYNRAFVKRILSKTSLGILDAENGKEAVKLCRENPGISLVLMDIKMPVMDGLEATGQIKAFRKDIPIIAITAYALSGDEQRILKAGCDDYLPKPFDQKELMEKLERFGMLS